MTLPGAWLVWMATAGWACSGPGAARAMAWSEWGGWGLLALTAGLVLAANLRARRLGIGRRPMAAGWIVLVAHPGIWLAASESDCGAGRLQSSLLFTILAAFLGIWGMLRRAPDDHVPSDERSPRP